VRGLRWVRRCYLRNMILMVAGLIWVFIGGSALPALSAPPEVIKFSRTMPIDALAGRADTDLVELSDGRRLKVADVRRLTQTAQQIRAAVPGSRMPQALKIKPAAKGTPVRNANDLAAALKRPDSETLELPNGRTLTVGQLKLVREEVELRLGHSLANLPQRPDLRGAAIKVDANSDWAALLQRPDNTVLESPNGTRITVGELKKSLAGAGTSRPLPTGRR